MPNLINILIPITTFYKQMQDLVTECGMHCYIETLDDEESTITKIDHEQDLLPHLHTGYHTLYITSSVFEEQQQDSFYEDDYCIHVIEVQGGRSTATELENLSLRIVSKTPDKTVTGFFKKMVRRLKTDATYGMGLQPSSSPLYRNAYYSREAIKDKTLWFDFKRKTPPLTVAAG